MRLDIIPKGPAARFIDGYPGLTKSCIVGAIFFPVKTNVAFCPFDEICQKDTNQVTFSTSGYLTKLIAKHFFGARIC
ncbi:hypothetical protein SeLEV6574_g07044 [Synchytrium endobioticum]|uniref:Uncharacterized protein n=1 Tax=Synchytrium endobioticum TaxID=286115 RepID=A0A507CM89_9FUNG|nr:hypothetical protein SeLEV6574_g07044 [Synchytrium endobioticum]